MKATLLHLSCVWSSAPKEENDNSWHCEVEQTSCQPLLLLQEKEMAFLLSSLSPAIVSYMQKNKNRYDHMST